MTAPTRSKRARVAEAHAAGLVAQPPDERTASAAIVIRLVRSVRLAAIVTAAIASLFLPDTAFADEEVSILGARTDPVPNDPLSTTTVIRGEELRAPMLQASEILRRVPGVLVRETGGFGSLSTASVRGATSAQTPVYLAGIRLNDDVGGTADLSLVPTWLIRSVTVQRSGGSPALDTTGLGGAILFDPFRPQPLTREPYELRSELSFGSFGAHGARASGAITGERAYVIAGVHNEGATNDYAFLNDRGTRFDSTDDIETRRQNADVNTTDAWALGEFIPSARTRIRTVTLATKRQQGLSGLGLYPTTRARAALGRMLFGVSAEADLSPAVMVSSTLSVILSRAGYDDPDGEAGFGSPRVDQKGSRIEDALVFSAKTGPLRVIAGLTVANESLDASRASGEKLEANRTFSLIRGAANYDLGSRLSLYAMASGECHHTSANGIPIASSAAANTLPRGACTVALPAGRLGARATLTDSLAVTANVGRYGRVPTLGESYGINGFVRGNPDLRPETGVLAEVGSEWQYVAENAGQTRARVAAFVYARWSEDLIAYASSPLGYARPYNSDRARAIGAELDVTFAHGPFRLHLPLTLMDGRRTDDADATTRLPYLPLVQVAPRVEGVFRLPAGPLRTLSPYITYTMISERNADRAGLVVINAQDAVDVGIAWAADGERFVLRARGTNILDARRFDLVGYPLPGRSGFGSVETRF